MTGRTSQFTGSRSVIRGERGIRPTLQQGLDGIAIAVFRCGVERREASALTRVRIGAALEQKLHDPRVSSGGGTVQRRDLEPRIAGNDIHFGASLEQEPRGLVVTEERGEMEGGEAVARPGGDE